MTTPTINPVVTAQLVEESVRLEVLPRHFGPIMLVVESAIYFWAATLGSNYRGGFWNFYEFGEGGFYMAPDGDQFQVAVDTNGYEGVMSADAFGIMCCLFAFSNLSFEVADERLSRHYHLLREFSLNHREAREITLAID